MANYFICLLLQRLALPLIVTACCFFRPVGISLFYLLLLLYLPLVPVATMKSMKGHTGCYFKIMITLSTLLLLSQIVFQITLYSIGIDIIKQCELLEIILRHFGLIRLNHLTVISIIEWLAPDVIMFLSSIGFFVALKKISFTSTASESLDPSSSIEVGETISDAPILSVEKVNFLTGLGKFLTFTTLLLAAVLRPSIPGGVYFLVYLGAGTWWACYKELNRAFAVVCRILMTILAAHIFAFMTYQTPWPQEQFPPNSSIPRYLGFDVFYISTCENDSDIRIIDFNHDLELDSYFNPIAIVLCYFTLAITTSLLFGPKILLEDKKRGGAFSQMENGSRVSRQVSIRLRKSVMKRKLPGEKWRSTANKVTETVNRHQLDSTSVPSERTPLMRRSTKKMRNVKKLSEGSTFAAISESGEGIQMDSFGKEIPPTEEEEPTVLDQILYGLQNIVGFIYRNSYIFTNIIMMTWSIMFHSWLTFVFLIWANILWMIPNQRKTMLRSSPFIVIYAILLLLAQYIYGMDLLESELPSSINGTAINLAQIGFIRYAHFPCIPLVIKCLFTVMFWITLRQLIQEQRQKRQRSTIADMVAPLQVTVGAALAPKPDNKNSSEFIKKTGIFLNELLVKVWIWFVVIVLFVSGMAGNRMTGFRIVYMALFLLFLLFFQMSWRAWKKFMYGFWLTVIVYAMSILILVYTYQFDRFPEYWAEYLNISQTLQKDIGLEKYKTRDLFLHLVNPTLVVIMTVMQLHYFHKKFLKMLEIPNRQNSTNSHVTISSTNFTNIERYEDESLDGSDNKIDDTTSIFHILKFRKPTKDEMKNFLNWSLREIKILLERLWLLLELHLIKIIMIIAFLISVNSVSVLHVIFAIFPVMAVASRTSIQVLVSRIISLFASLLLLVKMIYQVEYIHHDTYDVICDNVTNPSSLNNADWIGMEKANKDISLANLLHDYIVYIALVTIHAVVVFRQTHKRLSSGKPTRKPQVMFSRITRIDAEKNTANMIKYLFNYGFYKFGIEVTLMATVALIGSRMDLIACFYAFWLCCLISCGRQKLSIFWPAFLWFNVILIPIQYIVITGLPPGLCFGHIWGDNDMLEKLQKWAMLPDVSLQSQVRKILFDFILLMFISRQKIVFQIEKRHNENKSDFPGGSNNSIIGDISRRGFAIPNPTPDFTSITRNWLDIIKKGSLLGFFWFTLAIVFLAGTNRVNLFSLGYLIGSFIFLWQGSDFYLKPARDIIRSWSFLLGYNVFVITFKTILQIPGCIFFKYLADSCCWFVHLLGITCIQKYGVIDSTEYAKCTVPKEEVGLVWDGICFGFLIIQLRIFHSYYFCHIVNDTKASNILASRGAQLIEGLRAKQMKNQVQQENLILQKIKKKMDRIKATQQKLLQPLEEPTSHQRDRIAPLARSHSMSSCAGYHTPIEDEVVNSINVDGECDLLSDLGPLTPRGDSIGANQAPSPSSAVMTVSLDGYLEPQRLSFGSPPGSELLPRILSLDESFPVFSPPPYEDDQKSDTIDSNTLVPTTIGPRQLTAMQTRQHRRQSSLNTVSWPDQTDVNIRVRRLSNTLNPPDETDDQTLTSHLDISHRRNLSLATSMGPDNIYIHRRQSSCTSWANYDEPSTRNRYDRQSSWGPIGEMYHRQSIISNSSRSPLSHHESIRSGDYYMFEELDNQIQLDLMHPKETDFDKEMHKELERKPSKRKRRMTLGQLLSLKKQEMKQLNQIDESAMETKRRCSMPEQNETDLLLSQRSTMSEPIARLETQGESEAIHEEDVSQPDGQKPSTSKDYSGEESSKSDVKDDLIADEIQEKQGRLQGIRFIWAFIESMLISITHRLNRVSRNYRYVMKVLSKEKRALKGTEGFGMALKINPAVFFGPTHMSSDTATEAAGTMSSASVAIDLADSSRKSLESSLRDISQQSDKGPLKDFTPSGRFTTGSVGRIDAKERRISAVPEIRILAPSLERGLDEDSPYKSSHYDETDSQKDETDSDEDFTMKEHSTVIELLMALWFAILSHTDFVCYLIVFMTQINSASILSLPLPLMVFFWGTLTIPRPTKTFWVTLIAYTQIVVLLKCVSQFDMLWWNQTEITPNQPLAAARILGIEKKKGYATYDLALLLILFFHRFMLKSMGLWKSEITEDVVEEAAFGKTSNGNTIVAYEQENNKIPKQNLQDDNSSLTLTKVDSHTALVEKSNEDDELHHDSDEQQMLPDSPNYFPGVIKLASQKYTSSTKSFFGQILGPASRCTSDVYAYMFLCDFINFLVLVFGFTSFGSTQGDGGVTSYLEENKVPITFLIMLLLQFVLIIIDRALYLRKYLLGKVIFQFVLIIVIHIWMFFILPGVTERSFYTRNPPIIWYLIKCFYLLLSAYQIRCGYPTRILGNFITKAFSMINLAFYKIYMIIPFLFELRTLMDWIWTDTSMSLFDWIKMEDIFTNIYQMKCSREMEKDFPQPRGTPKSKLSKYFMGGGMLFGLIALIWFPLALFALGNTVGTPNIPFDVTVSLRLGPYESVYAMSAQDTNIVSFTEPSWLSLHTQYQKDRTALTFLANYEAADVTAIVLGANSTSIWNISPPDRIRLLEDLLSNNTLTCRFKFTVSRVTYSKENPGVITDERSFELEPNDPNRKTLIAMLENKVPEDRFVMPHLMPKFFKVKSSGTLKPITQLIPESFGDLEEANNRNLSLKLFHAATSVGDSQMWWEVKEECNDTLYRNVLGNIPYADCNSNLVFYTFNDKIFPSTLSWLTAGGIIGMYTTFVVLFSRLIRGIFSGSSSKIMFDDLPFVDRVLQLCLDIYLVRESLEMALEEDLFAKLIFLYRSPETMIKWTRPKDEKLDGDDDDGYNDDNGDDGNDKQSSDKGDEDLENNLRKRNI